MIGDQPLLIPLEFNYSIQCSDLNFTYYVTTSPLNGLQAIKGGYQGETLIIYT